MSLGFQEGVGCCSVSFEKDGVIGVINIEDADDEVQR